MATQKEIQLRLQRFLELFETYPDGMAKREICEKLGIKIRTAEGMRNTLCQSGYVIETSGKGVGIWWRNKAAEKNEEMTESLAMPIHAEAAVYLYLIQTFPEKFTKESLFQKFRSFRAMTDENEKRLYASQSEKYAKIIELLIEEGHISFVKGEGGKEYIEPCKEASVCIPVMSTKPDQNFQEAAYALLDYLQNYSGMLDSNLLSVKSKLELLLDGELREMVRAYELRGRHSDTSKIVEEINERFRSVNYQKNVIHIIYRNRKNEKSEIDYKVGLIYYSKMQDNIYLLGEVQSTGDIINLRMSGVESVSALSDENECYMSEKFQSIMEKMFGATYDHQEYEVLVHFAKFGSIPEKIKQLSETRRYSTLYEEDEKLVYTDRIIGLSEFAAYLRQFGKSCEVISPQILRDEMAKSPERVLKRYKEEGVI